MKTCTVIIPAYGVEKWINDCINAFKKQKPLDGWRYEIVVGIDGCEKTAKAIKTSYWWSPQNVGVYVMLNSLISVIDTDLYALFGADDIPFSNYLKTAIPVAEKYGFTKVRGIQCDENLNPYKKSKNKVKGQSLFKKEVIEKLGGFYFYKTSCDTDFRNRAYIEGYDWKKAIKMFDSPLFYRRNHKNSLTKSKKTGIKSEYRLNVKKKMKEEFDKGIVKIEPQTTYLEYRRI